MPQLGWPPGLGNAAQSRFCSLSSVTVAVGAMLLGFLWQCITVTRNYGGDWTALYCIGSLAPMPPEFDSAYRFPDSHGFDGQFYMLIASDPLAQRDTARYVDEPDLRYRRILLPGLAHALGFGLAGSVPYSYVLVNLGFLFLGAWWMSKHAVLSAALPGAGWLFLIVPGVLISLDRQTVDMALTALCLGAAYAWRAKHWNLLFLLLPLICLARETGLLIAAAFAIAFLMQRQWRFAAMACASVIPFGVWSWWVAMRFPSILKEWISTKPYAWTMDALWHPAPLPFSPAVQSIIHCFDILALLGLLLGMGLSLGAFFNGQRRCPAVLSSVLLSGLCLYLFSLNEWTHVYDYGRIASPMAAFLLTGRRSSGWLHLMPSVLMTSRVVVQIAPQVLHAAGLIA